jgi:indole-3-glycerol phosphate synthase
MKDIIISPTQLEAAAKIGADAVLLIQTLFDRGYGECDVHEMIDQARFKNLEVLLETHTEQEFQRAIETKAPLIGINNRDLKTLRIDLGVTQRILKKNADHGKIVVSESGIQTPADLRFLWKCGAHAFLIGSAIMLADNIEKKVQEFVLTI